MGRTRLARQRRPMDRYSSARSGVPVSRPSDRPALLEGVDELSHCPLPLEPFAPFFALDDEQLRARGGKRYVADRQPGFPCRVSLMDATPGERVVLVPFTHQDSDSPYRASGPIFIRENAQSASVGLNEVTGLLRVRILSVRAYDADALMVDADVVDGRELESVIHRMFTDAGVTYLHVHFARPGCFACRVDRA